MRCSCIPEPRQCSPCSVDAVDGDFGGRNKEKWTPVTDTYKPNFEPWIETVEYQDLLPIIIDAELRYGKNKKPTGYAIPKAIWQSDIYRRPPTTWAAHLRTLEKKRNDCRKAPRRLYIF